MGLSGLTSSIDPHFHNVGTNHQVLNHIYDRLVDMDDSQRVIADLAETWGPIDSTTWEFKLRQGVTWHDGSPFTADDVIFTMERAQDVPNSPSSFGTYIKGKTFTKVDDYTVHVKTETPYPLMPNDLSNILIVSRKHGEGATTEDYNTGKAAIGTGTLQVRQSPSRRRDDLRGGRRPLLGNRRL